jgi:hypothetical protein
VVEGTPLLRVQTGNRLEGSNPFRSATCLKIPIFVSRLQGGFGYLFDRLASLGSGFGLVERKHCLLSLDT